MSTRTRPVEKSLEKLDFAVKCDFELIFDLTFRQLLLHKCRRKAVWAVTFPCCGHISLACQPHRNSVLSNECSGCGRIFESVDMLTWVRL